MKALDKTKNTIESSFWGILCNIISLLLTFAIRTIIIEKLGTEYVGLHSLFSSILQVLSLAELGIGSALVYSMYKPVAEEDYKKLSALLNYYRKTYMGIGVIIFAIGIALIPFIPKLIYGEVPSDINLYKLYLIFLFNSVSSYFFLAFWSSLLSAYQREGDGSRIQLIINIISSIIQITLLLLFENYYIYALTLPAFSIISNVTKYYYISRQYPQVKCEGNIRASERALIKEKTKALFLHKIGGITVNSADSLIISAFLGLTPLALYNNYYYILSSVKGLILVVFGVLTAGIGNNLIIHSRKENESLFYSVLCANGIISVVCATCLFAAYQDFMHLWVGESNMLPFTTMVLICILFFFHTIRRTIIVYRDASGAWIDNRWQPLVSSIFNLCINIILVQKIGLNGIVISTILAMLLIDCPWEAKSYLETYFDTIVWIYFFRILCYFITFALSCAIVYGINFMMHIHNAFIQLFFDLLTAIIVSVLLFCLWNRSRPEFKFITRIIKQTLEKKRL